MGMFIQPSDLAPFATIDQAKAEMMIEDTEDNRQILRDLFDSTDYTLIEAANDFEGMRFTMASLRSPAVLRRLYNPFRPSWGEPYVQVAQRMRASG